MLAAARGVAPSSRASGSSSQRRRYSLEVAGGEHVLLGWAEPVLSLGPVEVEGRDLTFEQRGVAGEAARDELERKFESLLRDRVKAELAAVEDECADPDPIREAGVGALEEECVRRQRRPAREQLRPVAGELEALAGAVLALANPEQLRRCVKTQKASSGSTSDHLARAATTGSPSAVK